MSFFWCECDKYKNGKQLELIKDSYSTFEFQTIEDLALSMKPLTKFDANDIVKTGEKKIINQIPEYIVLKSKPFKLTLDEFDDFIFNDDIFDEDSIDIETLEEKEIDYIDNIRKNILDGENEFILTTEREPIKRGSFYKQSCSIYLLKNKKQTKFFKKNTYKWESLHNKEFLLTI